jgi:ferredoxin
MQVFKKIQKNKSILLLKDFPTKIIFSPNNKTIAQYKGTKKCELGCLGCLRCSCPKCLYYDKNEIEICSLKDFPFDINNKVCPVDAIKVDSRGVPTIDDMKCIKCGLCLRRCPVGSLYFNDKGNVKANEDTSMYNEVELNEDSLKLQNEQVNELLNISKVGRMIEESDEIFEEIYSKIEKIDSKNHDLLGRNLLIALGCVAGKTRIGDVYTRMDAVYKSNTNIYGAVEIEFGKDTLDASRAILDDIAVLNVRYNLKKENNNAIVICLQLPNARQGYWQVIKDIKNVENIRIETLSIGAILLLIWNNKTISFGNNIFYIDFDKKELRQTITQIFRYSRAN